RAARRRDRLRRRTLCAARAARALGSAGRSRVAGGTLRARRARRVDGFRLRAAARRAQSRARYEHRGLAGSALGGGCAIDRGLAPPLGHRRHPPRRRDARADLAFAGRALTRERWHEICFDHSRVSPGFSPPNALFPILPGTMSPETASPARRLARPAELRSDLELESNHGTHPDDVDRLAADHSRLITQTARGLERGFVKDRARRFDD